MSSTTTATIIITIKHDGQPIKPVAKKELPVSVRSDGEFVATFGGKEHVVKGNEKVQYIVANE